MLSFDASAPVSLPKAAATLILVRGARPIEVFFVRRHAHSPFLGGAVVFPGGKLDDHDYRVARTNGFATRSLGAAGFATTASMGLALAACACRESLEEAGLLPLTAHVSATDLERIRAQLRAGASLDEAMAFLDDDVLLDTSSLVPFGRWITPEAESRRYDARFFICEAPPGQEGSADQHETTASVWASPSRMLEAFHRGDVFLAPPTLRVLELLLEAVDLRSALAVAEAQCLEPICPKFIAGDPQLLALPGDPLHDVKEPRVAGGTRFALRDGRFVSEWP